MRREILGIHIRYKQNSCFFQQGGEKEDYSGSSVGTVLINYAMSF